MGVEGLVLACDGGANEMGREVGEFDKGAIFVTVDLIEQNTVAIVDLGREGGEGGGEEMGVGKIF